MSAPTQPTDQSGQIISDEKSLERLFRASYSRWLSDAKNRLGAEAAPAAPKVVSKAYHLAWQDRKRFRSQEELDAFIGAQIHHGATREISRRAGLHRMDHHEGLGGGKGKHEAHEMHEMTVDEAWDRLQHTLQGGAPEAYRARASTARHEAAEHVKGLAAKRNWTPAIILGVVAVVIVLAGIFIIRKVGEDRAVTNALAASNVRNYETSYGQLLNVTLDDGTIARMGPETKLTVPNRYGIGLRAVKVEGTANFEVTQKGEKPFEVRVGQVAVLAQGTKFIVRKFRDDSNTVVVVKEDSVTVKVGDVLRTVAAGSALEVTNTGAIGVPSAEAVAASSAWAEGTVTIGGQTLRYIVPQLRRWYGLDIKVPDARLLDRGAFLSAPIDSKMQAIQSVEKSSGVKFTYVGDNMVFQDTQPGSSRAAATKAPARGTKRR